MNLHVFQFDGDIRETVIARDVADAWAVLKENTGCDREEYGDGEFVQLDDGALFKLATDDAPEDHGFPNRDGWTNDASFRNVWHSERTCAEWVALAGRGHLGSSEW